VRILVIRFSSIGDIVLTTPVMRCLKRQITGAEIHFVTKHKYASLATSNPYIDRIHLLKDSLNELIRELSAIKFDYIIDLHHNYRSARIRHALGVKSFSVDKLNIQKWLLVWLKIDRLPALHMVDRNLAAVAALGVKNDGEGLDFFVPSDEEFRISDLPDNFKHGYIAFVIAATWATKKLPIDKIVQICKKIDHPVIILGGKDEFADGEEIISSLKGNVMNFAGKLTLNQSASIVKNANVVLANDTGLMHIAAAFKKKILVFWGNTVPSFGMVPYQPHPKSASLEVENLKCRPCSKLGHTRCPKKHFRCMNEMNIEMAIGWINQNFNTNN
jgi:ADP-heptose:LPS heptosyltransferase